MQILLVASHVFMDKIRRKIKQQQTTALLKGKKKKKNSINFMNIHTYFLHRIKKIPKKLQRKTNKAEKAI